MADESDVNVRITADTATLAAELQRGFGQIGGQLQALQQQFNQLSQATRASQNAVQENTRQMVSNFGEIRNGLTELRAGVIDLPDKFMSLGKALLTIAAGGAFKDFVKEYVAGTKEVALLSAKFKITAADADALSDTLKLGGNSVEDYVGAYGKLNMQLTNNAQGLAALGFSTDVINAKDKDRTKILEEGYRVMMQYAEGPERDAAALKLFGKSADDAAKLFMGLQKNKEAGARLSEIFGQATKEEIASVKGYSATMSQLSLILEKFGEYLGGKLYPGVQKFADALLDQSSSAIPMFISAIDKMFDVIGIVKDAVVDFASFLVEVFAPSTKEATEESSVSWDDFMGVLSAVLSGAKIILLGLVGAFEIGFETIKGIIKIAAVSVANTMIVIEKAMKLDVAGAIESYKMWGREVVGIVGSTADEVAKKLAMIQSAQVKARQGDSISAPKEEKAPKAAPSLPKGGNRMFDRSGSGAGKEDNTAKAELALAKAVAEAKLQIAIEELTEEEGELKRSLERREITQQQFLDRDQAIKAKQLDLQIQAKNEEMAAARIAEGRAKKATEKLAIQAQEVKIGADLTKLEMQRADLAKDFAEQSRKASEDLANQTGEMRSQISALNGMGSLNAQLDSIARKFMQLPKDIANSAEAVQLKSLQIVQAQIDDTKRQFSTLQGADDLKSVGAKDLYNRGLLTEFNYKKQLAEITKQNADNEISSLNQQIDLLDQLGVGYDAQKAKLFEQRDALKRLKEGVDETAAQINESLRGAIEQGFTDATTGKGLKGFSTAILNMINGTFAKQFSNKLMGVINGSGIGGSGGLLGNLLGSGGKGDNNEAMAAAAQAATTSLQSMSKDGVEKATSGLLEQVTQQTATQTVSSMLNSAFESLSAAASAAATALSQVGSGGGGMAAGGGGGIMSLFGNLGGFLAEGGYAMGGTPYVVGENGPELFVPSSGGNVVNNDSLQSMGGGGNVYMNISTPNADSFRKASQQTIRDYGQAMSRVQRRNG